MKIEHFEFNHQDYWQICLAFCFLSIMLFTPDFAFAETDETGIGCTIIKVIEQIEGPIGKGIATIVIFVLAVGLFMGKFSWGLFLVNFIAIGMIFKARTVMTWLGGSEITATC